MTALTAMSNSGKRLLKTTCLYLFTVLITTLGFCGNLLAAETESKIARGGLLYDNWVKVTGVEAPKKSHPSYPADKHYAKKPASNWRCKECHGWDYQGKDGAYSKGKHATGITGITKAKGRDVGEIIKTLADDKHGFNKLMGRDELEAVSLFVSQGQLDMDRYIDRKTKMPRGNKAQGEVYFNTVCAKCHGENGLLPEEMKPLGALVAANPWEVMHKISNGQPDENMPALRSTLR